MVYVEYDRKTKQVIEIHAEMPSAINEGYEIAKTDSFTVGDEFEQVIWINKVDGNKNVLSYSSIRNNPNAQRLLRENVDLKQKNKELTAAAIDLADAVATQNAQLKEQGEALVDLGDVIAEVTS